MKKVVISGIPEPKGHYSPGVVHNGVVYVSGQIPVDPFTGRVETGPISAQTELAMANVERVLNAAGSSLGQLLSVTIYVSDMDLWDEVNAVYKRIMGDHKPSRAIVPVKELHYGCAIEIQAIAAVRE